MPVFGCPGCGKKLRINDQSAARRAKCPHCGKLIPVPASAGVANSKQIDSQSPTEPSHPGSPVSPAPVDSTPGSTPHQDTLGPRHAPANESYDFLAPALEPGEIGRLGSYRVLKVLGAGGMGVVFMAEDLQLKRLVALKAMKPSMASGPSAGQRFLREAQTTASIRHDHIVTIYQVGEDRGVPFLAMEFLEGESLDDRLKREGRLPLSDLLKIGREIAQGLAAAHKRGLIHRDIKPANIWLDADTGRVKILDFGLARAGSDDIHLTQTGMILGTPAYMAPEQARAEPVDHRCDLFSLGCVLYRMCTGALPFKGKDPMSVLMALATETPKAPRELIADVPEELSDLVVRLLAKDREKRPASAQLVAETIAGMDHSTLVMKPPGKAAETQQIRLPKLSVRASLTRLMPRLPVLRRPPRRILMGAVLVAGGFILAALLVIQISTRQGQLVIESDDPNVQVLVRQSGATIIDPTTKRQFDLKAGDYEIEVAEGKDGLRLSTDKFTIKRGEQVSVRVYFRPNGTNPNGTTKAPDNVNPVESTASVETELRALGAREADPKADREQLRTDVATFAHKYPGTPEAIRAAGLLLRLPSPLDRLDIGQVPLYERTAAGDGDAANAPEGLVAVLGDSRLKQWNDILCIAFNPDGQSFVTGGNTFRLKIWEAASGKELASLAGHQATIRSVAYHPNGKLLASASADGTVKLWDLATDSVLNTLNGQQGDIRCVAFTPDGALLASAGSDGTIKIWDPATAMEVRKLAGHMNGVTSVAFRQDGKLLASSGEDRTIRLWDPTTGKEQQTLTGHPGKVNIVTFRADGQMLASAGEGGIVKLWDVATAKELRTLPPHGNNIRSLAFDPTGKVLVSGESSYDARVLIWNPDKGTEVRSWRAHSSWITGLAIRPDGQVLATVSYDHAIKLWEMDTGKQLLPFGGHAAQVFGVSFNGDGQTLASASEDNTVKLWSTKTGNEVATLTGHLNWVDALAATPDGRMLVSGSFDSTVRLWDAIKRTELHTFTGHVVAVFGVAIRPDGKFVASASQDGTVKIWDTATGKLEVTLGEGKTIPARVSFSSNGKELAAGYNDGSVCLWHTNSWDNVGSWTAHNVAISGLAFSPDGQLLATGSSDGTIKLWNPKEASKELTTLPGHQGGVSAVNFRGDGQVLASTGWDGMIRLWDPMQRKELQAIRIVPQPAHLLGVVFSPDGRHVATANGNGTIYILRLEALKNTP